MCNDNSQLILTTPSIALCGSYKTQRWYMVLEAAVNYSTDSLLKDCLLISLTSNQL